MFACQGKKLIKFLNSRITFLYSFHSCKTKKYLKQLSKASIIIVFYDEYWSILLRTLHSIYNRTPHELLREIILVNDNSTLDELYEPLEKYVKEHFKGLVWIHKLNERRGLTVGRLEGAKRARGEVLVGLMTLKFI
jgi:polypeptide N-acetylgalactosaminyltransferase